MGEPYENVFSRRGDESYDRIRYTSGPPSNFNKDTVMIEIHNKYCRTISNFCIRWWKCFKSFSTEISRARICMNLPQSFGHS